MTPFEASSGQPPADSAESESDWRKRLAEIDRRELDESRRSFGESEAFAKTQRDAAKKKGGVEGEFAEAAEFAWNQIKSNGLEGEVRPYHQIRYTVAQGLKAAVHGREDGIATLVLQRTILLRLDSLKVLLWVVIALLTFIAYKLA